MMGVFVQERWWTVAGVRAGEQDRGRRGLLYPDEQRRAGGKRRRGSRLPLTKVTKVPASSPALAADWQRALPSRPANSLGLPRAVGIQSGAGVSALWRSRPAHRTPETLAKCPSHLQT
ncbi:uncharacterized protein UV8b_00201 [Ustilaginoidea virens]|uniref:Uncharacterized protein n=1 Tax=Ustilaginoidea virens TaxID=1159556 RepID=A0A8E5HIL5_USTVR|nr:uncharacterized protein UV8b_00201 [Ustilaginoidea virens]QUC15960.1 hypothetical protein UV8b_00201 [Ustilaginoidea virens]